MIDYDIIMLSVCLSVIVCIVAKRHSLQQKCLKSEKVNRNLPSRNSKVQLLTLYTDREQNSAQSDRRTDGRHSDAKSRDTSPLSPPHVRGLGRGLLLPQKNGNFCT